MEAAKLLSVVDDAIKAIDEKSILEFAGSITFYNGKVFAGNDKVFILTTLDEDMDCEELSCTVNGKDLRTVLSSIKLGEVDLTQTENCLLIKSNKVKAELAISSTDASIEWLDKSGITVELPWSELPVDFFEGLAWCRQSVSSDLSYRGVTCVKVTGNKLLSTDKFRISRYIMSNPMECDILIPKEAIDTVSKFSGMSSYTVIGESWICFKNTDSNTVCGARLVNAPFPPNIEDFFSKEGKEIELPAELKGMVEKATEFVDGLTPDLKRATIKITNTKLSCIGAKQAGNFEQSVDINYKDVPISFIIIPDLFKKLLDITNIITIGENTLSFKIKNFDHTLIANVG